MTDISISPQDEIRYLENRNTYISDSIAKMDGNGLAVYGQYSNRKSLQTALRANEERINELKAQIRQDPDGPMTQWMVDDLADFDRAIRQVREGNIFAALDIRRIATSNKLYGMVADGYGATEPIVNKTYLAQYAERRVALEIELKDLQGRIDRKEPLNITNVAPKPQV